MDTGEMNPEQSRNAFHTAEMIAEHLAWAWNYCATLRAFQRHAKESPDTIDAHGHFMSTLIAATWDALFLKLAHCSDRRKEANGFPKLFKQLRAYLQSSDPLCSSVDEQECRLASLHARSKVENWRNKVVAHHTINKDFSYFYEANVCSLDDIESFIKALNEILHDFSLEIWNKVFWVEDFDHFAQRGVDQIMVALKRDA